jgi:hypothetical protein
MNPKQERATNQSRLVRRKKSQIYKDFKRATAPSASFRLFQFIMNEIGFLLYPFSLFAFFCILDAVFYFPYVQLTQVKEVGLYYSIRYTLTTKYKVRKLGDKVTL